MKTNKKPLVISITLIVLSLAGGYAQADTCFGSDGATRECPAREGKDLKHGKSPVSACLAIHVGEELECKASTPVQFSNRKAESDLEIQQQIWRQNPASETPCLQAGKKGFAVSYGIGEVTGMFSSGGNSNDIFSGLQQANPAETRYYGGFTIMNQIATYGYNYAGYAFFLGDATSMKAVKEDNDHDNRDRLQVGTQIKIEGNVATIKGLVYSTTIGNVGNVDLSLYCK